MTVADRIFTRIGANDNIMSGQSTFMVELSETSTILHGSTKDSLVILDELGRGTSTFDGYAIAYAVLNYLANKIGCRVLFSTHYHMLTEEFENTKTVSLNHMACYVDEKKGDVTFLYKLRDGSCPKSYGMNVANMAGVPKGVTTYAEKVAKEFESNSRLTKLHEGRKLLHSKLLSEISIKSLRQIFTLNSSTTAKTNIEMLKSLQDIQKNIKL